MSENKRVIYIIGLGRSGTTLLDIILGNGNDMFSCGELNRYPNEEGLPYQYPENSKKAKFWINLKASFEELNPSIRHIEFVKLFKKFEYHTGFFPVLLKLYSKTQFKEYKVYVQSVYDNILTHISKGTIIDSSKYPARALNIAKLRGIDASYVYIKRNPQDVVKSFGKKDVEQRSKGWFGATVYYFAVSLLCNIAYSRLSKHHKSISIKYDDLIKYPQQTLQDIEKALNLDLSIPIQAIQTETPMKVGMIYYGNRVRLKDSILLQKNKKSNERVKLKYKISYLLNKIWY